MRVVIIGGSGHVGTYLVPMLFEGGHRVIQVSRGERKPYQAHKAWAQVQHVHIDRQEAEKAGTFGELIHQLLPDVVIDMICFTPESARMLVKALNGQVMHFLHCGTIWVYGPSVQVPTTEEQPRRPFGEYGINKAAIETLLLEEARRGNFPATILHPGHIVGPGWTPLNPQGNFDPGIYASLKRGEELLLPNLGLETVHHVHAEDVAQAFFKAMQCWSSAVGESFHVVSPAALTLRGFAEEMSAWYGQESRLIYLPWEDFKQKVPSENAQATWDHIAHSPNCSIDKAQRLLGYQPRYTSLQAVQEAVKNM